MIPIGRPKGLGRAPVSLTALPLEEKRWFLPSFLSFKPGPKAAGPEKTPVPAVRRDPVLKLRGDAIQAPPAAVKAEAPLHTGGELQAAMAQLWDSLGAAPAERGRVLQFVSATTGEGASTVAREFALYAAKKAKRPVWLVDLDLFGGSQHKAVAADAARFGPLGQPSQASPDGSSFITIQPTASASDGKLQPDARYIAAYAALKGRLWVTRFRKEAMRPGQSVRLVTSPRYWNALAEHAEYVVVDTPAADRSSAAVTLAGQVDATVLVVAAESADAAAPASLKAAIEDGGGQLAGLVFNRSRLRPPPFLEKLLS